jgi:hypothetical protein
LALVKTGFPTFNLMRLEPGWRLIYQDSLASLFGREGLPIVETLRRTVPPALPPDGALSLTDRITRLPPACRRR